MPGDRARQFLLAPRVYIKPKPTARSHTLHTNGFSIRLNCTWRVLQLQILHWCRNVHHELRSSLVRENDRLNTIQSVYVVNRY